MFFFGIRTWEQVKHLVQEQFGELSFCSPLSACFPSDDPGFKLPVVGLLRFNPPPHAGLCRVGKLGDGLRGRQREGSETLKQQGVFGWHLWTTSKIPQWVSQRPVLLWGMEETFRHIREIKVTYCRMQKKNLSYFFPTNALWASNGHIFKVLGSISGWKAICSTQWFFF